MGKLQPETLLVTGGAGFIGSCLVRQLVGDRPTTRIVNLDLLTYAGNLDSLAPVADAPNYRFVHGDICDRPLVAALLEEHRPRAVLHLAAESHVDRSIDGPAAFLKTNVEGTVVLLEAVRSYWTDLATAERQRFRFLHVSTDEVYGSLGPTGAFTEETPYAPNSPYAASKAASDHFVRAYHHTYGLPTLITHCSNNYGPYQFPEKLIPLMIVNAIEGRPLPIYGDGSHIRDWLYVDDHCRALQLVLDRAAPGEVYNIGGNCERTNVDIVRLVCALVDQLCPPLALGRRETLMTHVQDRPGHDRRYAIDAGKIRRELGWTPAQRFEAGLATTVRWYLDNSTWVERVSRGHHRDQRIGLAKVPPGGRE